MSSLEIKGGLFVGCYVANKYTWRWRWVGTQDQRLQRCEMPAMWFTQAD